MDTDLPKEDEVNEFEGIPAGVLIRDFAIFQFKTAVDGIKDAIVIPFSWLILALDLLGPKHRRGKTFYSLLATCESFDRFINIYGAARNAQGSKEGLFGGSEPGDGTFVGEIEGLVTRDSKPTAGLAG